MGKSNAVTRIFPWLKPHRGEGSWVYTKDRKFLDFTAGIGALSTGHCNPEINEVVVKQTGLLVHSAQQIFGEHTQHDLAVKTMNEWSPSPKLCNYFFTASGSEANDNAIKMVRNYTKNGNIISLHKGFHGRTLGAISLNSSNRFCRESKVGWNQGIYFCKPTKESFMEVLEHYVDVKNVAGFYFELVHVDGGIQSIEK